MSKEATKGYECESGRLKISCSWLKDTIDANSDKVELSNVIQLVSQRNDIRENNHTITVRKDDLTGGASSASQRCEIVLLPILPDYLLEWSSITVHSSSRIVEIYTDDRKNYVCTAKYQTKVAPHQYICTHSISSGPSGGGGGGGAISSKNLYLKFLSLDHPSAMDRQSKINIHNIFIVGAAKRKTSEHDYTSLTNSSMAAESIAGFNLLASMLSSSAALPPSFNAASSASTTSTMPTARTGLVMGGDPQQQQLAPSMTATTSTSNGSMPAQSALLMGMSPILRSNPSPFTPTPLPPFMQKPGVETLGKDSTVTLNSVPNNEQRKLPQASSLTNITASTTSTEAPSSSVYASLKKPESRISQQQDQLQQQQHLGVGSLNGGHQVSPVFIKSCIEQLVQSDEMRRIVHGIVDERMSYWEKRILEKVVAAASSSTHNGNK